MIHRLLRKALKLCLLACVIVAVFNVAKAHAATPTPDIACGSKVVWTVRPNTGGLGIPAGADKAIALAWKQVAAVAHVTARQGASATVRWEWADWSQGETLDDGITKTDGVVVIDHSDDSADLRGAALQQLVLRDVLRTLGVPEPTSTATLSARDKSALVSLRREQAEPSVHSTPTAGSTSKPNPHSATPPKAHVVPTEHPQGWTGSARAAHRAAIYIAAVLAALLIAWFALGRRVISVPSEGIARMRAALRRTRNCDDDQAADEEKSK